MTQTEHIENYNRLWKKQAALPTTTTYYVTMVRPKGSFTWTQHGYAFPTKSVAEERAALLMDEKDGQWDSLILPIELPRMPSKHAYLQD
jgi:hypothetical protein